MSKRLQYLFLLILPVLFFLSGNLLKTAQGPYYINFYDPSYVYLINSLNVEQGAGVGHFDHPGTTVQVIGAICIKIYYSINGNHVDVVKDVLTRPEDYLLFINRVMQFLNSSLLLFLGILTLRVSGNFLISIAVQLTPFISPEIFYGMITVTPENFLIGIMLIMTGTLIYYLFKDNTDAGSSLKFAIIFAAVCGTGMATKINFFPVIIIPFFLLKGIKQKIIFVTASILIFFVMIIPGISNMNYFFTWIKKLIIFDGRYGGGSANIINPSGFSENLISIFRDELFFTLTFIIVLTVISLYISKKRTTAFSKLAQRSFSMLMLIFISMIFQILIVAKQYALYYMLPAFMLCVLALILCSILIPELVHKKYIAVRTETVLWIAVMLISVVSTIRIITSYRDGNEQREEGFKVERYINENLTNEPVISEYQSANKDCALAFSISYAGPQAGKYSGILNPLLKKKLVFNPWSNTFHNYFSSETVSNILKGKTKLILQKSSFASPDDFVKSLDQTLGVSGSTYKKLFENKYGEGVYEISLPIKN